MILNSVANVSFCSAFLKEDLRRNISAEKKRTSPARARTGLDMILGELQLSAQS